METGNFNANDNLVEVYLLNVPMITLFNLRRCTMCTQEAYNS
jgi:hypothetical protein